MKYKDFYKHLLNERTENQIEEFISDWKKLNKSLYEYSCTLKNCGVYISKFIKDAREPGFYPMTRVFGKFHADHPSFDRNDVTEDETAEMRSMGLDSNVKSDRISYATHKGMLDDMKKNQSLLDKLRGKHN